MFEVNETVKCRKWFTSDVDVELGEFVINGKFLCSSKAQDVHALILRYKIKPVFEEGN